MSQLIAEAERSTDVVIARSGMPIVRLVPCAPAKVPEPGAWLNLPGWENYAFDPDALAPLLTDEQLEAEGWPV